MKKILVVGAGYLQSFVIKKAKEMGYYVLAVDADVKAPGFQYADLHAVINIIDEEACLEYARRHEIDGVLTAATDYGVLTAAYIAQEMNLPGLDYEVAKTIKNKYLVRKLLLEHHVDDTEQAMEINAESDLEGISKVLNYPVMVKPCDGSGSRGASRVDCADNLAEACNEAMNASITQRAVIESFVIGQEYGAESLIENGEIHVLSIMRKWMTEPPYYAELGHAIPCGLPIEVENRALDCVMKAIKALKINHGSVNMDMIISPEGTVHIIDVGARMGGNMIGPCIIPYGTGIDYMEQMLRVAVGEKTCFEPKKDTGAVCTRLLAFRDGVIKEIPDINTIEKKFDVEIYHHMTPGMHVNEYHTNLDGCGYIIAKAGSPAESIKKAEDALQHLKQVLFDNH